MPLGERTKELEESTSTIQQLEESTSCSTSEKTHSLKEAPEQSIPQQAQQAQQVQQVQQMKLEDFKIQAILGKGYLIYFIHNECRGYGKVYHVVNCKNNQSYAMKVLKKADLVRRRQVSRIKIERAILEQAKFPFITQLYYAFQTPYRLYMIMDFMQGGDLFTHLTRFGVFSEERTRFYIAEIVLALHHLHQMGIIYVLI